MVSLPLQTTGFPHLSDSVFHIWSYKSVISSEPFALFLSLYISSSVSSAPHSLRFPLSLSDYITFPSLSKPSFIIDFVFLSGVFPSQRQPLSLSPHAARQTLISLQPSWTSTRTLQSKRLPDALIWDGSASLKHYKDEELYRDYDSNMVTAEGRYLGSTRMKAKQIKETHVLLFKLWFLSAN